MKKLNLKLFISSFLFIIAVVASTNSVFAQSDKVMLVNIPFDFNVGNQEFTAGKYNLARVSDGSFLIRSVDGEKTIITPTPATSRVKKEVSREKIVFHKYGNQYFLRQIFSNRMAEGYGLIESKAEKTLRKELSNRVNLAKNSMPEQVSIVIQ